MKQVVLSFENMKELEELGIDTSDASFAYDTTGIITNIPEARRGGEIVYAYTLEDLLDKIPTTLRFPHSEYASHLKIVRYPKGLVGFEYADFKDNSVWLSFYSDTGSLLKAAYKLFIWCIKNNKL